MPPNQPQAPNQPQPVRPAGPGSAPQQPASPSQAAPANIFTPTQGNPAFQANQSPQQVAQQPVAAPASSQPQAPNQPTAVKKPNPNSTQNTLEIAEIRDGIVIMQDGSFRAVVLAQSINFDLMSQGEREAVEQSYQGFINSLFFPIQIMIRSVKVNLQSYMEKLTKIQQNQDNVLLGLLMEDYIGYMDYLTQTSNIMDKQFYIVVPYYPEASVSSTMKESGKKVGGLFKKQKETIVIEEQDFLQAKTELKQRVQSVLEGMIQMNVQGIPLNTQELIELYYSVYNPDTASTQQLAPRNELSGDMITKGEGNAPQPHLDGGF